MAIWRRKPRPGLLIHSDQGAQFTSREWAAFLREHNLEHSMSRRGNCHDNAVAESFFQLLKREKVRRRKYRTREEVDAMRKQHDPIDQMREVLKNQNITDEQLKSIDSDVKVTVTKATEFAQTSPEPDESELHTDILLSVDDDSQTAEI